MSREKRKTCLSCSYYTRVFRANEVVDQAVPRGMNLTAREVQSHRDLESKLFGLECQKRRSTEKMARKIEELDKELEAARKTGARLRKSVRGNRTSQDTKHRTRQRGNSSGSGASLK